MVTFHQEEEMNAALGPVPPWSAPPIVKLAFFLSVIGVVFAADGFFFSSKRTMWRVVVLAVLLCVIVGIMSRFHA